MAVIRTKMYKYVKKDFRGIWKALPLSAKFSSEEKEKINTEYILQQICTYFLTH